MQWQVCPNTFWSQCILYPWVFLSYCVLALSGWAALWVVWQSDMAPTSTHKKYTLTRAGMLRSALSHSVSDSHCHVAFLHPLSLLTLVILWASTELIRIKCFKSLARFPTLVRSSWPGGVFLVTVLYIGCERKWLFPKVKKATSSRTLRKFFACVWTQTPSVLIHSQFLIWECVDWIIEFDSNVIYV